MPELEEIAEAEIVEHTTLLGALLAFQAEAPKLTKDATAKVTSQKGSGYSYRYLTLDKLMGAVLPLLNKNGLVWMTFPEATEQGVPRLRYELAHAASGEKLSSVMPLMLSNGSPQELGSAISYGRRYAIISVLGLAPDEDDDGASASQPKAKPKAAVDRLLSPDELERMVAAVAESGKDIELLLGAIGVEATDDVTVEGAKKVKALL